MRVLVTGGAGFIGSHSVEALVAAGLEVTVYDDLSTGSLAHLATCLEAVRFVHADICDRLDLRAAAQGCDAILHLAALVSVPMSIQDPDRAHAINATGTLNVLEAARAHGIRRVVQASSAAVYGASTALPLREEEAPQPLSPYASQKLLAEVYASVYAHLHGLEPYSLRYFNVYGPRQDPRSPYSGVLSRFMALILAHEPVTLFGDGGQTRDFVFVRDVAEANVRAILAPAAKGARACNVGTGHKVSVRAAFEQISQLAAFRLEPNLAPEREGDVRDSCADVSRASQWLGWAAGTDFQAGLAETLAWARSATGRTSSLRRG